MKKLFLLLIVASLFLACTKESTEPEFKFTGGYIGEYTSFVQDQFFYFDSTLNDLVASVEVMTDTIPCTVNVAKEGDSIFVSGCDYDFKFEFIDTVFVYNLFGRFPWYPVGTNHFKVTLDENGNSLLIDDAFAGPDNIRHYKFSGTKD